MLLKYKPTREGQLFYNDLLKLPIGTKIVKNYEHLNSDGITCEFRGLTNKKTSIGRDWRMKLRYPNAKHDNAGMLFLADLGCVPYKNGWNSTNYLTLAE